MKTNPDSPTPYAGPAGLALGKRLISEGLTRTGRTKEKSLVGA
jgi:hypothetical protein